MLPDSIMFKENVSIAELQKTYREGPNAPGSRRAALLMQLAALSKRFLNEKLSFEALLSEEGIRQVSGAVYCMEWATIYYAAQEREAKRLERGYWKTLWNAVTNKRYS